MMPPNLSLRSITDTDLPIFFQQQLDPEANYMAAFTAKDPSNREAFNAHWNRIRAEPTILIRTILCEGQVAGSVLNYEEEGRPEVSYWLGREFWGQGHCHLGAGGVPADCQPEATDVCPGGEGQPWLAAGAGEVRLCGHR